MITIDINDAVTPRLRALGGRLANSQDAAMAVARPVRNLLQGHFDARDAVPNKNHFPRAHFWAHAARATGAPEPAADGAVIVVRQPGVELALRGGMRTKERGMYAIPARPEAAGKFPREFNNLRLAVFRSGAAALVLDQADKSRGSRSLRVKGGLKENQGLVFYWLHKDTRHQPDPAVLPPEADLHAAMARGLEKYLGDNS